MSLFRRVGLLVAGAIASSLLVALPVAPAHADYDLSVTWPAATQINPNITSYKITVSDSGPGNLFAVTTWDLTATPVAHSGQTTVTFGGDGEGAVALYRCSGDVNSDCVFTDAASPQIAVHHSVGLVGLSVVKGTSSTPGQLVVSPNIWAYSGFGDLAFDWSLRDAGGQQVASASDVARDPATFEMTVEVPSGLSGGDYTLFVTAHGTFAGGPVTSEALSADVSIDTTTPEIVSTTLATDVIFPVRDYFRDALEVDLTATETAALSFRLLAEDGTVLGDLPSRSAYATPSTTWVWTGKLGRHIVDPGNYRVEVRAQDLAGNYSNWTPTALFRVDLAEQKDVTVTTTVTPSTSVFDRYVGRCSSLTSPSSHGWKGSLGYYSQTKCKSEKKNASVVVVWHAAWLPTPGVGDKSYHWVKVQAFGGAAKGHAKGAYMVMGYIDSKGAFGARKQFDPRMRWHPGARVSKLGKLLWHQDGRAFFVWSNGLTSGSRYDIRSFKLQVNLRALVEPDGTLIAAPKRAVPAGVAVLPQPRRALTTPSAQLSSES
ncbi:MAG: hypothetical protein U0R78_00775 [Nocardioidaceae bacterium]